MPTTTIGPCECCGEGCTPIDCEALAASPDTPAASVSYAIQGCDDNPSGAAEPSEPTNDPEVGCNCGVNVWVHEYNGGASFVQIETVYDEMTCTTTIQAIYGCDTGVNSWLFSESFYDPDRTLLCNPAGELPSAGAGDGDGCGCDDPGSYITVG